jgi:MFS family permease
MDASTPRLDADDRVTPEPATPDPVTPPAGTTGEPVTTQPPVAARGLRRLAGGQLAGLPRPFWWLWLGTLVNRAGTFIEPFFVLYLTGPRHVSVQTAGVVLTVWGVGSALSQPFGGFLTDRLGRRVTLAWSLGATAALLLALSVARGLVMISLVSFLLGVVADMYRPAAMAVVADLVAEGDRARAYALQFWAINLGFSVAAISAGVLLHHVGFGLLFVLDAATTLAFGMLSLRFVPETKPDGDHEVARLGDSFRLLAADRLLAAATVLMLVYAILYLQVNIALPLAVRAAGLSASVYGYAIAINGVLIVVGQPLTLRWLQATSRQVTLPVGMTLVGLGLASTGLCTRPWQFGASVVLWTVGEIATAGAFQALVASIAPPHMRGRYGGTLGLAWGTAGLLGPLLGTAVFAFSPAVLWISCAVAGAAAGLGLRWVLAGITRRTAEADVV